MRAWTFQDTKQKQKLGSKAPWSVGWYDPDGNKRSKKIGSKSMATKFQRKIEGELAAGTYEIESRMTWADFIARYRQEILQGGEPGTVEATEQALSHFERIAKPKLVAKIKTLTVDEFIRRRSQERGRKKGSKVSPATINKELRHLRAILNVAVDWEMLPKLPKLRMVREPERMPRIVESDHFAAIYQACEVANRPGKFQFSACDWWRALMCFTYMTGWRIGEPMAVPRRDIDLEKGVAITRHGDNKGNRDERVTLHPVVIEHLERIVSFEPEVFPWLLSRRALYDEFLKIQQHAGIRLDCREKHEHTEFCHVYGFHDIRRAFATTNAPQLSAVELQGLMRHKSYQTTQKYIRMAEMVSSSSADKLAVPAVLLRSADGA